MTEQDENETAPPEPVKVPDEVKKPADRKPRKKAAPKPEAVEDGPPTLTAEVRGEKYEVPADSLDDFELLDDLARVDDGDVSRVPSVLRRLLGPGDMRRAMGSLRDEDTGRVSVESGAEFVGELLEALDPNS